MRSRRKREELSPDITPLIDVIFILLIFFMTTTVFKKKNAALLLALPKAETSTETKEDMKSLAIQLNKDEFMLNGKKTPLNEFDKFCQGVKNTDLPVELKIDKKVTYDRIVKVIDVLQKFKMNNLSLVTETI